MSKFVVGAGDHGMAVAQALADAGVIKESLDDVARVVIDLRAGEIGRIYIEKFADSEALVAMLTDTRIVVEEEAA